MTDHFDTFINNMSETEYEDWLEDRATETQEEKALNIRTPLTQQEEHDIEEEQYYQEQEQSQIKQVEVYDDREDLPEPNRPVQEVYDNRDLPPRKINVELSLDAVTGLVKKIKRQPIETIKIPIQREPVGIDLPTKNIIPKVLPQLPQPQKEQVIKEITKTRANIAEQIRKQLSRISSLLRRTKK